MKRIKYYLLVIVLMFPLIVFGDHGPYKLCSYKCPHETGDEEFDKEQCDHFGETITIAYYTGRGTIDSVKLLGVVFDGRWDHEVRVAPDVVSYFNGSCPAGQRIRIDSVGGIQTVTISTGSDSGAYYIYTSPSDYNERERTTNDVTVFDYFENGGVKAFRKRRYQYNNETERETTTDEYSQGYLDYNNPPVSSNGAFICIYGSGSNQLALAFERNNDGSASSSRVPLGFVSSANGKSYMCRIVDSSDPIFSSGVDTSCPYMIYCDRNKCYKSDGPEREDYSNGSQTFVTGEELSGNICRESVPLEVPEGREICKNIRGFRTFIDEKVVIPLRIAAVIIFLILTTVDYAKVIFDKEASPKKANIRLFKRLIALLIIFFANEIVNFVMLILGQGCPRT